MKKLTTIALLILGVLTLTSCGGAPSAQEIYEEGKSVVKVYQPDWYDVQDDEESLYFFGEAEKKNQNMSKEAALANARTRSAEYVEVYVQNLTKNYMEEVGVEDPTTTALVSSVTKTVAKAKFSGTNISDRETIILENGNFKSFVRLSVPKEIVNKQMVNEIKKEEELYNRFKASQSFDELEKEVENY